MEIKDYKTPQVKIIEAEVQSVLCQSVSGNRSMEEIDFGNGGFEEV